MATRSFLPNTDKGLLAWVTNFILVATPIAVALGLTSADLTAFSALLDAFQAALAACDPGVRNKAAVFTKRDAARNLRASARVLARIVEAKVGVTDAQKALLGLTVRAQPSPIPVPPEKPILDVVSVDGRTVTIHLHGPDSTRRGKPDGVAQAYVFSYVGANPPADPTAYDFNGGATRTTFEIQFPLTVAGGARVWLTACWVNPRGQTGMACEPVGTYLGGAASETEAA